MSRVTDYTKVSANMETISKRKEKGLPVLNNNAYCNFEGTDDNFSSAPRMNSNALGLANWLDMSLLHGVYRSMYTMYPSVESHVLLYS